MLTLPMQKKWWLMIYNNQKPEEYREIGPYWGKRFKTIGLLDENGEPVKGAVADMTLANGSGPKAPTMAIRVKLKMRDGEYILPILRQERVR